MVQVAFRSRGTWEVLEAVDFNIVKVWHDTLYAEVVIECELA